MVNSKRGSWGGAEDCHWFKVTPCTPHPDIYCNFLLNWPLLVYHQWGTVRGRNRSSDFLLSINQVYFEYQGNKSISTFAKAYTGTWFLPGWMQSHCLPGLCQQYLCACVWQPQQHVMPKQLWPLHLKTPKDNTSPLKTIARAWQPLLTKDHGLWCTQISLAFCTSAKVSNCPLAFRVMANLRNHKWRWTHRGPTKTLEQHSSQCGSCIVFNTTLCRRGSAGEGTGTAVLSCS